MLAEAVGASLDASDLYQKILSAVCPHGNGTSETSIRHCPQGSAHCFVQG